MAEKACTPVIDPHRALSPLPPGAEFSCYLCVAFTCLHSTSGMTGSGASERAQEMAFRERTKSCWEQTAHFGHVSRIRTSDFTGLTDNQGLIILGVSQRVIFSEGNYLKNNFCHTGCPRVRRACLCATLLIWK